MKKNIYICPATGNELRLFVDEEKEGSIRMGFFQNPDGLKYFIKDGFPDFTYPIKLNNKQNEQYKYYEANAEIYDDLQGVTFAIHNEDEETVRKDMLSYLNLTGSSKVLEVACGTGIDTKNIAALLDKNAELYVQDLSGSMLQQCRKKLQNFSIPIEFSIGDASHLAFPDNYFDAVFSFGGLNVFADIKKSLQEMLRVTKPGGRIVVGDESMPPWLYGTEFGKTLINGNPLFKHPVPLEHIPIEARDVSVRWIIGGVYYLISFTVGTGEPVGNFDVHIPGKRGGTLKTRYYGQLEGVTEETKKLVIQAAEKSNKSVHKWLDDVLRLAVDEQLK